MKKVLSSPKILVILLFLLIIINGSLAYFYFSPKNIIVYNNSKHYSISYHQTKLFSEYLKKWQVFEKESQLQQGPKIKVKKIIIVLTDEEQTQSQYREPAYTGVLIHGGRGDLHTDGTLNVNIYLNPSIATSPDKKLKLNEYAITEAIEILYKATHDLRPPVTGRQIFQAITSASGEFTDKPSQNPITIKIR